MEFDTESEDYDGLDNDEFNTNEIESFDEMSYSSEIETDTDEDVKYSDMGLAAKSNCNPIDDAALSANLKYDTIEKDTWIADSGASTHMCMNDDGMFDITKTNNQFINVGNGHKLPIAKKGKKKCVIHQKDGKTMQVTLENVYHVPQLWYNLFSVMEVIKKGWRLGNNGMVITLRKDRKEIKFDIY